MEKNELEKLLEKADGYFEGSVKHKKEDHESSGIFLIIGDYFYPIYVEVKGHPIEKIYKGDAYVTRSFSQY